MSNYTPATHEVRGRAISGGATIVASRDFVECPHWAPGRITRRRGCTACAEEIAGAEFDRWLHGHKLEVAAETIDALVRAWKRGEWSSGTDLAAYAARIREGG